MKFQKKEKKIRIREKEGGILIFFKRPCKRVSLFTKCWLLSKCTGCSYNSVTFGDINGCNNKLPSYLYNFVFSERREASFSFAEFYDFLWLQGNLLNLEKRSVNYREGDVKFESFYLFFFTETQERKGFTEFAPKLRRPVFWALFFIIRHF